MEPYEDMKLEIVVWNGADVITDSNDYETPEI